MKRTIEELRNAIKGRIYIYCKDERIGKQFMQDAEKEGYRFGKIKPTENGWSNIIAVEHGLQLSFVGFVGHMNFQCGSSKNLTRVDYEKYINDDKNFLFENETLKKVVIYSNLHGEITVVGDECFEAATELKKIAEDYESIDTLCDNIESKFKVIVIPN